MDPYDIIYHPFVTEKTMSFMENNNSLEFVVKRNTNKKIIKKAIEQMFDVKVKNKYKDYKDRKTCNYCIYA